MRKVREPRVDKLRSKERVQTALPNCLVGIIKCGVQKQNSKTRWILTATGQDGGGRQQIFDIYITADSANVTTSRQPISPACLRVLPVHILFISLRFWTSQWAAKRSLISLQNFQFKVWLHRVCICYLIPGAVLNLWRSPVYNGQGTSTAKMDDGHGSLQTMTSTLASQSTQENASAAQHPPDPPPAKRTPGRPKGSGKKEVDPNAPQKPKRPVGRPRKVRDPVNFRAEIVSTRGS